LKPFDAAFAGEINAADEFENYSYILEHASHLGQPGNKAYKGQLPIDKSTGQRYVITPDGTVEPLGTNTVTNEDDGQIGEWGFAANLAFDDQGYLV